MSPRKKEIKVSRPQPLRLLGSQSGGTSGARVMSELVTGTF